MRVALDARTMQLRPIGGIGRGLANLVPRLREHVELTLLTDRGRLPLQTDLEQVALRTPVRAVSASWLQLPAARWLGSFPGVFHCPFYALPFRLPVPGVATLHDLTFEHFPEMYSARHRFSFRVQARHAARTAAVLLTPSQHVRADLVSTYQVAPDRVLVAPNGVDPVFRPSADGSAVRARLGVRRPYLVALGGAGRRNLPLAVAAWSTATKDHDLVVVGTEQPAPQPGLVWAGAVGDEEWAGLLAGAEAFVYPTAYEGYGMPGIEALAAGAPVLATRTSALPEVLGPGACWAESLAVEDLARALADLLSDGPRRSGLRAAGLAHAATAPGWDASAEVHLQAYARAAAA